MSELLRALIPRHLLQMPYEEVKFKTSFQNCVLQALLARGWQQCEVGWTLQWSQKERVNEVFAEGMTAKQRLNHFRLYTQLCRKDMLMKNIRAHKRQLHKKQLLKPQEWNFLPLTFFLPSEYVMFAEQFRKQGGLWIMKPTARCQGQGIFIIDKLVQVAPYRQKVPLKQLPLPLKPRRDSPKPLQNQDQNDIIQDVPEATPQSYLIQQYISNPLLFGMKKFDLRIYALCTNYSQLTVWIYRSGFARFTHEPYCPEDIGKLQSHLTNVEIQKHSQNYDEVRGGKWLLDKFKHYLSSKYQWNRVDKCFTNIKDIILKSLQAVQRKILPSKNSFQLYGYDFMIDCNLSPWLIEVNGGPSMTANTPFDNQLKCGLIDDALSIIDIQGVLTGNQTTVGGFDLVMKKDINVKPTILSSMISTLGTKNERKKVMLHIAKQFMFRKYKQNIPAISKVKETKKEPIVKKQIWEKHRKEYILQAKDALVNELHILQREQFYPIHSKALIQQQI